MNTFIASFAAISAYYTGLLSTTDDAHVTASLFLTASIMSLLFVREGRD